MASYWLESPSRAYAEKQVQVTAKTDDDSVKKVSFELSGAISYSKTIYDTGWKAFTCKTYASSSTGRVDVKVVFMDEHGWTKETKYCWFDVVTW